MSYGVCATLALLSQSMPLELSLEKRFLKFINRIPKSGTGIVKAVLNVAKSSPWSTCGRNFRDILFKYDEYMSVCEKDGAKRWYKSVTDEEFMRVGMISELIDVRDERMSCQGFTRDDVSIFIVYPIVLLYIYLFLFVNVYAIFFMCQ